MKHCIAIFTALFYFAGIFAQSTVSDAIQTGNALFEKGDYANAETIFNQIITDYHNNNQVSEIEYSAAIHGLAKICYFVESDYQQSDSLFFQALQIRKKICEENSPEYAETLIDWSIARQVTGKYDGLEDWLKQAMSIRKASFGENSLEYAEALTALGELYSVLENQIEAMELLYNALSIRKNAVGENHFLYAHSLLALGDFSIYASDINAAEIYYTQAKYIYEKTLGKSHPKYLTVVSSLSLTYAYSGRLKDAIDLLLQIMPVVEKRLSKKHPVYIACLSNLGSIYRMLNEREKAEYYLSETLIYARKSYGEQHPHYFNAYSSLALFYQDEGLHETAEPMLIQSLQLRKELYGEKHSSVSRALNSLGIFYLTLGNYSEAEKYLFESLEVLPYNPVDHALLLSNISLIFYNHYNDTNYALKLAQDAVQIYKENNFENHWYYIDVMNNIIIYLSDSENPDYTHIENLHLENLQKLKAISGEYNTQYITTLMNLAIFYTNHSKYEQARKTYLEVLNIYNRYPGLHQKIYYINLHGLAFTQLASNNIKEAQSNFELSFNAIKKDIQQNFVFLSEKERELFWLSFKKLLGNSKYFSYAYMDEPELSTAEFAYNIELLTKSVLLNASQQVHASIVNSGDETLTGLWDELSAFKNLYLKEEIQQAIDSSEIVALERKIYEIERDISRKSRSYRDLQNTFELTWKDVRQALNKNEAAIEFVYMPTSETEANYYALLLRPGYEQPLTITLCSESDILKVMQLDFPLQPEWFYKLIWEPLENYMEDVSDIFISPAGLLHGISFEGIKKDNDYLCDKYIIHRLLSTKDIVNRQNKTPGHNIKKAVIFGGADFGLSSAELTQVDSDLNADILLSQNLNRGMLDAMNLERGQGFDYLPGTKREAQLIEKQLSDLNWETQLFIDKEATETRFKSCSSTTSSELLHISTHGFYFPPVNESFTEHLSAQDLLKQNVYRKSDNPLMRTGLAFSGANHVWSGKEPSRDVDDGILTAYEVSNMNLSNTELVVLSACKTGLGDITGSEGVFGLQRAFRLAGVQSMIVSLWDVPDKETQELMTEFYSQWNTTGNIKKAFSNAQQKMREKYPDDPQKWAGFVVIE